MERRIKENEKDPADSFPLAITTLIKSMSSSEEREEASSPQLKESAENQAY